MKKLLFIFLSIIILGCIKDKEPDPSTTTSYAGKYIGEVTLSSSSISTTYNMVVDLSSRNNSNEYNFLFANRQSIAIVTGKNFTIPKVQGAPSFMVSGNGSFLDSGNLSINYTEEIDGERFQNFKGILKKF